MSVLTAELDLAAPGGGTLSALAVTPPNPTGPAVLFLHWGFGDRRSVVTEARAYARAGARCVSLDAPGRGRRHGKPPRLDRAGAASAFAEQCVLELTRGVDWLVAQGADPARLAYVGHSLGASVGAAFVAREPRLAGAVLAGGYADVSREGWSPRPDAEYARLLAPYDATRHLPAIRIPVLLQFARRDAFVSAASAERAAAAAPATTEVGWYDTDHALDGPAAKARGAWLATRLGLTPPDEQWLDGVRPPWGERLACKAIAPVYGALWRMAGRRGRTG